MHLITQLYNSLCSYDQHGNWNKMIKLETTLTFKCLKQERVIQHRIQFW